VRFLPQERAIPGTRIQNQIRLLLILLGALLAAATQAANASPPVTPALSLDAALAQARDRRAPVLVEISAAWCHSCYYMAKNVLVGPDWQRLLHETVVLEVDSDSPQGAQLRERFQIKGVPTYLFLDADGAEIDRILGDLPREKFYDRTQAILARGSPLSALAARVKDGSKDSQKLGREVLMSYVAREDGVAGLDWWEQLPKAARAALEKDPKASLALRRLHFQQAAETGDTAACLSEGAAVLAADLGCDRALELARYLQCAKTLEPDDRTRRLQTQRPALEQFLDSKVLRSPPACSDDRDMVLTSSELYRALGDSSADRKLLARTIAFNAEQIGGDLRHDRGRADNQRVFLEQAGRMDELEVLLKKLIAAYPEDYVYANRYARFLADRGQHMMALDFFTRAAQQAYGLNRLRNAEAWATSLLALGRRDEARGVISEALAANGPWFLEDATRLKTLLGS
jgi:thiol-disulfide isomerase/thioredoxin